MKKYIILIIISISMITTLVAEEISTIDSKTGFPEITEKPFPIFNYGLTVSNITRIVSQTERSNFIYNETLAGLYFTMESRNMQPVNSLIRIAAYYP